MVNAGTPSQDSWAMIEATRDTEWAYQVGPHLALCFYECVDTPVLVLHFESGETAQWDAVKYERGLEVATGLTYERVSLGWFELKPSEHRELMSYEDEVEEWIAAKYDEREGEE